MTYTAPSSAIACQLRCLTAVRGRGFASTVSTTRDHTTTTYTRGNTTLRIVTGPTRPGKMPVKAYELRGARFVEVSFNDAIATMMNFGTVAA